MYFYVKESKMFGYVRADVPQLRVRENEYYRAVYCGLCRAQGKCTGQCSRFTLNYDMTFLALLRIAIDGKNIEIKRGRCIAHPFKKRAYVKLCEPLSYCAYASAILTHGKIVDDIDDEHGLKKLKAIAVKPFSNRMRKKALKNYSELDKLVFEGLKKLSEIEKKQESSVDIPAAAFGEILADIASYGLSGNDEKIMREFGKHIGRWIYVIDAIDDIEDDLKAERFNALACMYGGMIPEDEKESLANSLKLGLLRAEAAYDLIDFKEHKDIEEIVANILYRGMPKTAERVLKMGGDCCDKKQKGKSRDGGI